MARGNYSMYLYVKLDSYVRGFLIDLMSPKTKYKL